MIWAQISVIIQSNQSVTHAYYQFIYVALYGVENLRTWKGLNGGKTQTKTISMDPST